MAPHLAASTHQFIEGTLHSGELKQRRIANTTKAKPDKRGQFPPPLYATWIFGVIMNAYDDYNDPAGFRRVERFFPSKGAGDILFTSRHKGLDRLCTIVEVPPMPTADGVNLLLRGYSNINVTDHIAEGLKIVTRLGGLALAIDQAAAYIQYKKLPLKQLASFLTLYEAQRKKILRYTSPHFWKYSTMQVHGKEEQDKAISAFTTWEMSFQQLKCGGPQTTQDAGHFLTLSAFFNPSHIGESIFRHYWETGFIRPGWMRIFAAKGEIASDDESSMSNDNAGIRDADTDHVNLDDLKYSAWDGERFWDVIAEAHALSLLESISSASGEREASFSLHPLIRDWLQLRENAEQRRGYMEEAIKFVVSAIQVYETVSTTYFQKGLLVAHVDACVLNNKRFSLGSQALGRDITNCDAASWLATFYRDQGRHKISEKFEELILRTRERVLGKEHPFTLTSMINLAQVLSYQGKYEQAEEMQRQVLGLQETVCGKEHPSTLTSMNNLAQVLSDQGKYEQAEEMHRQEIAICQRVMGKEHPHTLISMNNFAWILCNQDRLDKASELAMRVLETSSRLLGSAHPATLRSMANLAYIRKSQGQNKDAIDLMTEAMRLGAESLGFAHPNIMNSAQTLNEWLAEIETSEGSEPRALEESCR